MKRLICAVALWVNVNAGAKEKMLSMAMRKISRMLQTPQEFNPQSVVPSSDMSKGIENKDYNSERLPVITGKELGTTLFTKTKSL